MNSPLMGAVIVEALIRLGVTDVLLAPGSRNAPISLALFEADRTDRLRLHVRIDERSAGFTALGIAKASQRPVAVVTTSGTATANLAPAAMEARSAGVGLLVITADRPSELIGTGANQTGHQIGILGPSALEVIRLSAQSGNQQLWAAALTRAHAIAAGLRTRQPGPVQVNVEFSPPLAGAPPEVTFQIPRLEALRPPSQPLALKPGPATVVLAGDASPAVGAAARGLAEAALIPLFAEPSSNARCGPSAIANYRELLDGELGQRIERVIVYGHPTLSRPVTRLLSRDDVEVIIVADQARWYDTASRARAVVSQVTLGSADQNWLASWQLAQADHDLCWDARGAIHTSLGCLTDHDIAVIGASDVIRHADLAPIPQAAPTVFANRGLSGIDGTIATAAGISLATKARVTAIIGDLTFQHDLGSLVIPDPEIQPNLRIIVIDNGGGAIFASLEQGAPEYSEALERVFTTPQHLDCEAVAAAIGWKAVTVHSPEQLTAAMSQPGNWVIVAKI